MSAPPLSRLDRGLFFQPAREPAKVGQFSPACKTSVSPACGGQNENAGSRDGLGLPTEPPSTAGKFLVSAFAIKRHHPRARTAESPLKPRTTIAKICGAQLIHRARPALHQVCQPESEFEHACVFLRTKPLRHEPRFVQKVPELVPAPRVIMANARRPLAGVEPDEDNVEPRLEVIG